MDKGSLVVISRSGLLKYAHNSSNPSDQIGILRRVADKDEYPYKVDWCSGYNCYQEGDLEEVLKSDFIDPSSLQMKAGQPGKDIMESLR